MKVWLSFFLIIFLLCVWAKQLSNRRWQLTVQLSDLVCKESLLTRTQETMDAMRKDKEARVARAKGIAVEIESHKESYMVFRSLGLEMNSKAPDLKQIMKGIEFSSEADRHKIAERAIHEAREHCSDTVGTSREAAENMLTQFITLYLKSVPLYN